MAACRALSLDELPARGACPLPLPLGHEQTLRSPGDTVAAEAKILVLVRFFTPPDAGVAAAAP